jgi:T4 RnlA family RNA ligase
MKVKIPNKEDGFGVHEHEFCGIPSYLIIPSVDAKWHTNNLFFRSLIVHKETNEVLSAGFPKFFNYGEKPDCYPDPEKYKDWKIQEKLDGSLVICDYENEKFSMRTRGSVSYMNQANYEDFQLLPQKYPQVVDFLKIYPHISLLFEIVTPNNIIVLRPSEIEFYFLGAVDKVTLQTASSQGHEKIANILHIPTPKIYNFDSLKNTIETVKAWKGQEGIVLCYNDDQNRVKIKSDWYCWIHKIKSQLNSENNLIEYYVNEGMPDYNKFYKKIETEFDWELAEQMKKEILRVCETSKKVSKIKKQMQKFLNTIKNYETRKEKANAIINAYDGENLTSFVFTLLDDKDWSSDQLIKLMHKFL